MEANFDSGLNIITGETGAGKSILINAIELVFSQRVSKDVIKTGEDRAFIELVIECSDFKKMLADNDIEDFGNEIIISKEITQNSVRSRINGTVVNSDLLKMFREKLIDIHSQHQTYVYMQPKLHINLLDSYGKSYYGTKLDEYKNLYSDYVNLEKELDSAKTVQFVEGKKIGTRQII